jgi:hypothetical protein
LLGGTIVKRTGKFVWLAAALVSVAALCSCEGSIGPGVHLVSEGSGEKKLLRLQLEKGSTYSIHTESDGEYTVGEGSTQLATKESNGLTMAFYVADVNDSGAMTIDVRYTRLSYKAQGPMGVIEFDSSYPAENMHPAMAGLKVLVGKGFRIDMGSDGSVRDVQGIDKMVDQIAAEIEIPPRADESTVREEIKASMKEEFEEKNIKGRMKNMLGEYPSVPVGVGACWKVTSPSFYPPCSIDAKYTLKSRSNGIATIQVNAVIKPDKSMAAAGYTYDVSGHMSGIIEVEEATGLPVKGAMLIEASGTRTGTSDGSTSSPFTLKGSLTVKKAD